MDGGRRRPALNLFARLRERGVVRVALSYAVIAWLLLQVGDVVLDPVGAPAWVMRALITLVVLGFPVALVLAWFFELTPAGIARDRQAEHETRPTVPGIRRYADVIVIGVLLVAVVFLLARQEGWLQPPPEAPVVAVLPFTELGGPEAGYFGAGLADTMIHKLGELGQLVVLASSSTLEFRGTGRDLAAIGSKLGATALLEGTVQRAGGLLRVNARLVDSASGRQLWSGTFDRNAADLFAVQDEIAGAVTGALSVVLTPEQETRITTDPTTSLSAYDAYLRALDDLASRDHGRITSALRYLRDAVELDPEFALAHAALAEAYYLAASYRYWDTEWQAVADDARRAAATAQALDPALGEAWLAQALVAIADNLHSPDESWPDEHIRALLQKAVELNPNNAKAWKELGRYATDPQQAVDYLVRAARLDPRSGIVQLNLGEMHVETGDFEQAEQQFLAAALTSEPRFMRGFKALVEMHLYDSVRLDSAARWATAILRAHPDDWMAMVGPPRALIELGAWAPVERLLADLPPGAEADNRPHLWIELTERMRLELARDRLDAAAAAAETFTREFLIPTPHWPEVGDLGGPWLRGLEILALRDIRERRPEEALERYRLAYPDRTIMDMENFAGLALRAPVVHAVLHREAGDPERADALLREALAALDGRPLIGGEGVGFTRFTIHAFLGETDAAIAALQEAVDAGWLPGWWGLDDGAFDAKYAAVLADPRYLRLYAEIERRVTEMREDFLARPELPEEKLRAAGLAP